MPDPVPNTNAVRRLIEAATIAAVRQAVASGSADADAAISAAEYANAGRPAEARAALEAVEASSDLSVLFLGFQFYFRSGDLVAAERWTRRRLVLAAEGSADQARAHTNLGLVLMAAGGATLDARQHLEAAVAIDERLGHLEGVTRDLGNLANWYEAAGKVPEAEAMNHRALAMARSIGSDTLASGRLANLGDLAASRGDAQLAADFYREAIALFRKTGQQKWIAEYEGKLAKASKRDDSLEQGG